MTRNDRESICRRDWIMTRLSNGDGIYRQDLVFFEQGLSSRLETRSGLGLIVRATDGPGLPNLDWPMLQP